MIDWSKSVDKSDPVVLAQWSKDLRAKVETEGVWQCEAYRWILELCDFADSAIGKLDTAGACRALDEAAYHWYRCNK